MNTVETHSENIGHVLTSIADSQGDAVALIEAATGKSATFAQVNNTADRYAAYLESRGVRSGDRVILMVKPSIDFICLTFSLFKLGTVIVLIDPGMGMRNLKDCIIHVKPKTLIGIPKALLFKKFFPSAFATVEQAFCCGFSFGLFGPDIRKQSIRVGTTYHEHQTRGDDLAAIIFTSGSTGIPKGVHYRHTTFTAQLRLIRDYYAIGPGDIDQPAFPLFSLFSTALGARAVIPDMDSTKPAQVDPKTFVDSIKRHGVTYSFGSPALWRVVSKYCLEKRIILDSLKLVLIAGAPVPGGLVEQMLAILPEDANLHTPYGATESLPIVSIEGREIVGETWPQTRVGKGICVGRSLPGVEIRVIEITDDPIATIDEATFLDQGEIGEIIVRGDVVTTGYDQQPQEDKKAKISAGNSFYHRMGDTGYLDNKGRLWFCGRKSHRVTTVDGTRYPICCEAITNEHPHVYRSALVGVTDENNPQYKIPVLIVEPEKNVSWQQEHLLADIRKLAATSKLTGRIDHFLIHQDFPVDIRHNAKIVREKLAVWAQKELSEKS